jgi:hypothetical protein
LLRNDEYFAVLERLTCRKTHFDLSCIKWKKQLSDGKISFIMNETTRYSYLLFVEIQHIVLLGEIGVARATEKGIW